MSVGPLRALVDRLRQGGPGGASRLSDGELLARWATDRDEAAFELLVWRHGRLVYSVCQRLLRHAADVDDAFQATFLVLVRKARSIGRGQALASWLHTVATRVALEARRRAARHAAAGGVEGLAGRCGPGGDAELRAAIDEEVARLSEKYRIVFVLCCLEGKTDEAAARELGCAVGTVHSRLSRARARLRERLRRRGITPAAAWPALAEAGVPSALAETTVQAAAGLAAGSPAAAALVEGAVHAMFLTKFKTATVAVLAVALLGVGGLAGYGGLAAQSRGGLGSADGGGTGDSRVAGKDLRSQLEEAKANVARLEKAIQDRDRKRNTPLPTPGRGRTDVFGGGTTAAPDLGTLRALEARAKSELGATEAALGEARNNLSRKAEAKDASDEELAVLKALVARGKAEVDLKQAQLRLATLARERADKAARATLSGMGGMGGSPSTTSGSAPTLESRVKALEDQLKVLQKEMQGLRAKQPATGSGASPYGSSRP